MMEGGQGCLVGLLSVDVGSCSESHPISLKSLKVSSKANNLERFIVGRQFLVVVVVFLINTLAAASPGASVLNLPGPINSIFVTTGAAIILTTIVLGQLTSQVNAARCMLDFINNHLMVLTTYLSLIVEFSGLLHVVYLFQIIFSKLSGKSTESIDSSKGIAQQLFFWIRVLISCAILVYSYTVIIAAVVERNTTMWGGVPRYVSVILLFAVMAFVGIMEGIQIALFACVRMPEDKFNQYPVARKNRLLVFRGQNLQAFLIGRQICATIGMFVIARITTPNVSVGSGTNVFGVSNGVQIFYNTGLLGAFIFTVVASLIWRLAASSFPTTFLSLPFITIFIRLCLLLESTGICSSSWIFARYTRLIPGYQPDEVYLENNRATTTTPESERDRKIDRTINAIKYVYSFALLTLSVTIIMATIVSGSTRFSISSHPSISIVSFWCLVIWLAVMEGGLGCLVGLQPVEKSLYSQSHPITYRTTSLAHKNDNMERFIVGRQFLVVLVMFMIAMCGSGLPGTSGILNLPEVIVSVFISSGLAMILTTIMLGQLTSQLNAAVCMLDFTNKYLMLFTTYMSLLVEFSGLLHSVYLVQILFAKLSGKPNDSPQKSFFSQVFFWIRVLISCAILGFAMAVTLRALFQGQTTMWKGVPEYASVLIFFLLMSAVGLMEGLQIALFAVLNMPEEELSEYSIAQKNCSLVFSGNNLGSFLIGRQICSATGMFVVAKITSLNVEIGTGNNIFQVSDGLQTFLNTGLLGALITTILASLIWRVIASSFPLQFLSNPLIYVIIRLCLFLESTGICSASWLLALLHKSIAHYQIDEVYLGAKEKTQAEEESQTNVV